MGRCGCGPRRRVGGSGREAVQRGAGKARGWDLFQGKEYVMTRMLWAPRRPAAAAWAAVLLAAAAPAAWAEPAPDKDIATDLKALEDRAAGRNDAAKDVAADLKALEDQAAGRNDAAADLK